MEKKFKLLGRREDCILLYDKSKDMYKVIDVEGDVIIITPDKDSAESLFKGYSLAKVRRIRQETFSKWCKEFVEE